MSVLSFIIWAEQVLCAVQKQIFNACFPALAKRVCLSYFLASVTAFASHISTFGAQPTISKTQHTKPNRKGANKHD